MQLMFVLYAKRTVQHLCWHLFGSISFMFLGVPCRSVSLYCYKGTTTFPPTAACCRELPHHRIMGSLDWPFHWWRCGCVSEPSGRSNLVSRAVLWCCYAWQSFPHNLLPGPAIYATHALSSTPEAASQRACQI